MVSGAGTFSVRDTKHASWPWSKQPLTARGVRLGYLILCTVFGVAHGALGRSTPLITGSPGRTGERDG